MPILDIQRRLHEIGRIRIGATATSSSGKTHPTKLDTFRFTSQDLRALATVAELYGGTVEEWKDAPVGQQGQVTTGVSDIPVAVPPGQMGLSQSYELWSGGGCVRRCDGQRQQNDEPCFCTQLDDDDDKTPRCSRHTRVSLMLADLATTGLWRLDTQGFYASEELAGAFELAQMIAQATGRALLPGRLRLEQREIRRPGQTVKRFAVPVLDLEMNMRQLLGGAPGNGGRAPALDPPKEGLTPIPEAWQPPSLAAELERMSDPKPESPRRKNAAAQLPSTGLAPRTASEVLEPAAPTVADSPPAPPPAPSMPPTDITEPQLKKLMVLMNQAGLTDREDRLAWTRGQVGRAVGTSRDLTFAEASKLIDRLEELVGQQVAAAPAPAVQGTLDTPPDGAAEAILDVTPERLTMVQWARQEAGVDQNWMRKAVRELGLKDVPDEGPITGDLLARMSGKQARLLLAELNSVIDQRGA